ncbi:MAG: hypothetical protein JSV03_17605 [Planctomycetota bacterium]|nr:MAG: hypothetical protein JSV03_17605 [Planctomycetota bacterium]
MMHTLSIREIMKHLSILTFIIANVFAVGCQITPGKNASREKVPTPLEVAQMLEDNVTGVVAFYDGYDPFIWSEDQVTPRGIIIKALYLKGPEGTGVFGNGVIHPKLYTIHKKPDGARSATLIKEWAFDVEEALPFRSKKPTTGGWGYRLHILWDDLELTGREIRLIISFERRDGIVVNSRKKDFRVMRRGY